MSQPIVNAVNALTFTGCSFRKNKPVSGRTLKAVCACLAGHHNGQTGKCCPSQTTIGKETQTHVSVVGDAVKLLELMLLFTRRDQHGKRGLYTQYDFREVEGEQGKERFRNYGDTTPGVEVRISPDSEGMGITNALEFRYIGIYLPLPRNWTPLHRNLHSDISEIPVGIGNLKGEPEQGTMNREVEPERLQAAIPDYNELLGQDMSNYWDSGPDSVSDADLEAQATYPVCRAVLSDGVARMHGDTLIVLDTRNSGFAPPLRVTVPVPRPTRVAFILPAQPAVNIDEAQRDSEPARMNSSYTWAGFCQMYPSSLRLPDNLPACVLTDGELVTLAKNALKYLRPSEEDTDTCFEVLARLLGQDSREYKRAKSDIVNSLNAFRESRPHLFASHPTPEQAQAIYNDHLYVDSEEFQEEPEIYTKETI